ncbi:hypothetical protein PHMEG_00029078 [Phytophthora megakarya]|uniref:Uncharacterized protein n=1 Tax=Phytophthora megakarya TaxID=4795 RepID=A0A225V4J2_9STRA|nr:hypothetical protein PHMEG_00029078 [Phytophthora megakarya]
MFKSYKQQYHLKFLVRGSQLTEHYNSTRSSDARMKLVKVPVCMYEHLVDEWCHPGMNTVWEGVPKDLNDKNSNEREGLRSWLQRWHKESMLECNFDISKAEWVKWPHQPDAASCGVLIVTHTYNCLAENTEGQICKVSKSDVTVMILRMLWAIMRH